MVVDDCFWLGWWIWITYSMLPTDVIKLIIFKWPKTTRRANINRLSFAPSAKKCTDTWISTICAPSAISKFLLHLEKKRISGQSSPKPPHRLATPQKTTATPQTQKCRRPASSANCPRRNRSRRYPQEDVLNAAKRLGFWGTPANIAHTNSASSTASLKTTVARLTLWLSGGKK
jgi:hypothetical protein